MTSWRISTSQERWLMLARRFRPQAHALPFREGIGDWRSVRLISRCLLFILGGVAAAMTVSIANLVGSPSLVIPALLLVAVGEWLIVARRLVFAGIEEALICVGLLTIAFEIFDHFDVKEATAALWIAGMFAIAGVRLLNPLFTTLAMITLSVSIEMAMDMTSLAFSQRATTTAGLFSFAVALIALGLGALRYRRPSYDAMLDWLVIAMPLVGYLWLAAAHDFSTVDSLRNRSFPILLTPLLPLVFALVALTSGVRRRTHAPLIAFMVCIACLAVELRHLTGLPLEGRLIVWGALLLGLALGVDRYLRTPHEGITCQKVKDDEGALQLLELGGTVAIGPHRQNQPKGGFKVGGGSFGGGGASGEY